MTVGRFLKTTWNLRKNRRVFWVVSGIKEGEPTLRRHFFNPFCLSVADWHTALLLSL